MIQEKGTTYMLKDHEILLQIMYRFEPNMNVLCIKKVRMFVLCGK